MQLYVNKDKVYRNIDGYLIDPHGVVKRALRNSDTIDLDDYILLSELAPLIEYCKACVVVEGYNANFCKVSAYKDILEKLKTITRRD